MLVLTVFEEKDRPRADLFLRQLSAMIRPEVLVLIQNAATLPHCHTATVALANALLR